VPRLTADRVADAIRASFPLGALAMLALGRPASALGLTIVSVTVLVLRRAPAPTVAHLVFLVPLAVDVWLTATGAMARLDREDTVGHVILPAAVTPLLFHLAVHAGVLAPPRAARAGLAAAAVGAAALTVALGSAYELVEAGCDAVFGTNMSLGYHDTVLDLAADACGAVLGGALLARTLRRGGLGRRGLAVADPPRDRLAA
jgi:hypothetical protein